MVICLRRAGTLCRPEVGKLPACVVSDAGTSGREQFPRLGLAEQALRQGGDAAIVLNAANEVAVDAFLKEDLRFGDIHQVVGEALRSASGTVPDSLEAILECDARARAHAATLIQESFAPAGGRSQHA